MVHTSTLGPSSTVISYRGPFLSSSESQTSLLTSPPSYHPPAQQAVHLLKPSASPSPRNVGSVLQNSAWHTTSMGHLGPTAPAMSPGKVHPPWPWCPALPFPSTEPNATVCFDQWATNRQDDRRAGLTQAQACTLEPESWAPTDIMPGQARSSMEERKHHKTEVTTPYKPCQSPVTTRQPSAQLTEDLLTHSLPA